MSTPPFLDLPPGTRACRLATARGEFAVLDTAPAGSPGNQHGRPVALLLPGYTGSKEDFIAILADLAATGRRVVAVDQRGQYETPGPDSDAAYQLDEFGADALAVIDALDGGPVHLLGHSYGGLVARAAVLAAPAKVRTLTLLGSGPAAVPGPAADRVRLMLQALDHYDLPTLYEAMLAVAQSDGAKPPEDPAVVAFLRRRFLGNQPASLRGMARGLLGAPDLVAELAAAGVPVQVVYGADDDAWPPHVQADMARRLGGRELVIPGAAHSPAVEQPEETAAALASFWASRD